MNSLFRSVPKVRPYRRSHGFTLIELLVVIAIVTVLATLTYVIIGRVAMASSAATMTNNFRQLGSAITMFADENGGRLPGPLHLGQRPIYRKSPPTHLAYHLKDYFSPGQEPQEGQLFEGLTSPIWRKKTPTLRGISLLSQQDVDPDPRVRVSPWGYAGADRDDPYFDGMTMSKLFSFPRIPWALVEADREHPLVGSAGWRTQMVEKPVHGNYRLALNFDGSVVKRYVNEELEDHR